jgi:probable rRNA maturation factor
MRLDRLSTAAFMIVNRQRAVRVSVKELGEFVSRARHALRLPAESVTICLVTNPEIARWNRAYRGKNGPTDVLSFPVEAKQRKRGSSRTSRRGKIANATSMDSFASPASTASSVSYLGDIAIAPAVARRNARRFGRTLGEEMRILILHGMLHLMGYDHETDNGQMERREQRMRRALGLA